MQLLAVFKLNAREELSAELREIETNELQAIVEDDGDSAVPFQNRVKAWANSEGHQVSTWDRSALHQRSRTIRGVSTDGQVFEATYAEAPEWDREACFKI